MGSNQSFVLFFDGSTSHRFSQILLAMICRKQARSKLCLEVGLRDGAAFETVSLSANLILIKLSNGHSRQMEPTFNSMRWNATINCSEGKNMKRNTVRFQIDSAD
jgi:hypothetical protein